MEADPGPASENGNYALFIGRLSKEKGIVTLLEAWKGISDIPLKIAGEGPLNLLVRDATASNPQIDYLGQVPNAKISSLIKNSRFVIVPSECYEHFPMVIVESLACGRPVLASRIGSLREIVIEGVNGILYPAGSPVKLRYRAKTLWRQKELSLQLGLGARKSYETRYTKEINYRQLMKLYNFKAS